jgi:hypothetical protein
MPSINRDFDSTKHKLSESECQGWKGVEASLTCAVQQHIPHFSVLNQEEKQVKLNKYVIAKSKMMNKDKIFMARWQDIVEDKIMMEVGIMELSIRVMSIPKPLAACT